MSCYSILLLLDSFARSRSIDMRRLAAATCASSARVVGFVLAAKHVHVKRVPKVHEHAREWASLEPGRHEENFMVLGHIRDDGHLIR